MGELLTNFITIHTSSHTPENISGDWNENKKLVACSCLQNNLHNQNFSSLLTAKYTYQYTEFFIWYFIVNIIIHSSDMIKKEKEKKFDTYLTTFLKLDHTEVTY